MLLALSADSPFWHSRATGFASWRSQLWVRWPSSGPAEPFPDPQEYRATVEKMIEWGVAVDEGMPYLDARIPTSYPTIEIRVADVCTDVEHAVLVAALARPLVEPLRPAPRMPPGAATCCGLGRGGRPSPECRTGS